MSEKFIIPASEFNFTFSRSSGAGGQNIQKVSTKATLHWDIFNSPSIPSYLKELFAMKFPQFINHDGLVVIISQAYRTQIANKKDCLDKLNHYLGLAAHIPKARKKTKPKKSAVEKRLKSKKMHSEKKKMRSF